MRLATLLIGGKPAAAAQMASGAWLNIAQAAAADPQTTVEADSLQSLIQGGDAAMAAVVALMAQADSGQHADAVVSDAVLMAPIPYPRKNIFCVTHGKYGINDPFICFRQILSIKLVLAANSAWFIIVEYPRPTHALTKAYCPINFAK